MGRKQTNLRYLPRLPTPKLFGEDAFLVFDRRLVRIVPEFRAWTKGFPASYGVNSGEKLKDINEFCCHMESIEALARNLSARKMTMVVMGGGSVGDFGGFVASVYKRGVRLVHIPTTWLAAIDSSHGGKTALNVNGAKNQIGTFYAADEVLLVRSILRSQPKARAQEACGELVKMAFLDGGNWIKQLERVRSGDLNSLLWRTLRHAIQAKYDVVAKDPREINGRRQILNLGHTLGHILEASLGISHGEAVAQGLFFSLDWSLKRGDLCRADYGRARAMQARLGFVPLNIQNKFRKKRLTARQTRQLVLQDKKRDANDKVTFVFLRGFGHAYRMSVSVNEFLAEAREQGWVK